MYELQGLTQKHEHAKSLPKVSEFDVCVVVGLVVCFTLHNSHTT